MYAVYIRIFVSFSCLYCIRVCVCVIPALHVFVWLVKLKCYTLSMQVAGPLLQRQGSIYRGAVLGFLVQLRETPFPSWRSLQDDLQARHTEEIEGVIVIVHI